MYDEEGNMIMGYDGEVMEEEVNDEGVCRSYGSEIGANKKYLP